MQRDGLQAVLISAARVPRPGGQVLGGINRLAADTVHVIRVERLLPLIGTQGVFACEVLPPNCSQWEGTEERRMSGVSKDRQQSREAK